MGAKFFEGTSGMLALGWVLSFLKAQVGRLRRDGLERHKRDACARMGRLRQYGKAQAGRLRQDGCKWMKIETTLHSCSDT
ncbi:MAG: hypothetical protein M9898_12965 [Chitinophagaceae bacterium]|nr:hypothetical protein [Chitinophagaceae bacterium]